MLHKSCSLEKKEHANLCIKSTSKTWMTQTHTTCYNRLLFRSLLEGLNMLQRKKKEKKKNLLIIQKAHTNALRSMRYGQLTTYN